MTDQTISRGQHRHLEQKIAWYGIPRERVKQWVLRAWGVAHLNELPVSKLTRLHNILPVMADQIADELEASEEREAIRRESCGLPMRDD